MSRFLPSADSQPDWTAAREAWGKLPKGERGRMPGPSAYAHRPAKDPDSAEWVTIADTDPFTGRLDFEPDWPDLVGGWQPLDRFLGGRF